MTNTELLDLCKAGVALIEGYFTYQYNLVSSMGILGLIMEEVGVDIHFSLAEILSWVVAFPAALVARCRGYSALFPATVAGFPRGQLGADPPDGSGVDVDHQTGLVHTDGVGTVIDEHPEPLVARVRPGRTRVRAAVRHGSLRIRFD